MNPKLIKSFPASAEVKPYRIIAFTDGTRTVATAKAGTEPFAGFSNELGADGGETADLTQVGLAEVTAGGPLKPGDFIMSDADGCAVVATAASGEKVYIAGIIQDVAAAGDIIPVLVATGVLIGS